ncbi:hypothetical protein JDV02_006513 [Purpureocillium takamizusanense]|uniref:F-box domain-containing protein n=1 Tax=Purpureocillium takamizusanense TaxID=2060973 RepID=A0A9Q8QGF4_9HYPO|nr:uncharacterized protein JDV02_006513 [Purpureocillium takamizusanense]UNI20424.1 hypothetical protein JDV02_006513 [Purpureocillium takamizusanense]
MHSFHTHEGPSNEKRIGITCAAASMNVACFVCGYDVCDRDRQGYSTRWLEEFRLVTNHDGLGVSISGIGIKSDLAGDRWTAPLDYTKHWADMGAPEIARVGVMFQGFIDGRYGYPVHVVCWELARRVFAPEEIDPPTMFSVLDSLPAHDQDLGLDWGHRYGGLLMADHDHHDPALSTLRIDYQGPTSNIAKHNPLNVIEHETLHDGKAETPFPVPTIMDRHYAESRDPFAKLPPELLLLVSCDLSTLDVARVRLASRAFRPVFDENQFWKSRFTATDERRWVFEVSEWRQRAHSTNQSLDWRSLYYRTSSSNGPASLQNRERIWRLLEHAREVVSLRCFQSPVEFGTWLIPDELAWDRATAEIHEGDSARDRTFTEGCRLFHTQQVLIPDNVTSLEVFLVHLGSEVYVAGLAFRAPQSETIALGYKSTRTQTVHMQGRLSGLEVSIGNRGVHGLQCVFEDGSMSQQVGRWVDVPQTGRLGTGGGPIAALEVGYDGFKIVSLAVGRAASPP